MKKIIKNWYYIAVYISCLFGLLLCLGDWDLRMKTLLAGTMFIQLHFFEEFGYPGGFPWQGMRVERGAKELYKKLGAKKEYSFSVEEATGNRT